MNSLTEVKTEAGLDSKKLLHAERNSKNILSVTRHMWSSLKAGIEGFAAIFGVIIVTDFLAYLFKFQETFSIDIIDILLSTLGFVCLFVISWIRFLKSE